MSALNAALTRRERVILARLAEGLTIHEIAAAEFVTVDTVRSQRRAVLRKLNARTAAGAVHCAHLLGLLESTPGRVSLTARQKLAIASEWLGQDEVARLVAAERRSS